MDSGNIGRKWIRNSHTRRKSRTGFPNIQIPCRSKLILFARTFRSRPQCSLILVSWNIFPRGCSGKMLLCWELFFLAPLWVSAASANCQSCLDWTPVMFWVRPSLPVLEQPMLINALGDVVSTQLVNLWEKIFCGDQKNFRKSARINSGLSNGGLEGDVIVGAL